MHLAVAAIVVFAVPVLIGVARVGYLLKQGPRSRNSTPLSPDWRPDAQRPPKQRPLGQTVLLTVIFDPIVIFLVLVLAAFLFGPFRPLHEWAQ